MNTKKKTIITTLEATTHLFNLTSTKEIFDISLHILKKQAALMFLRNQQPYSMAMLAFRLKELERRCKVTECPIIKSLKAQKIQRNSFLPIRSRLLMNTPPKTPLQQRQPTTILQRRKQKYVFDIFR